MSETQMPIKRAFVLRQADNQKARWVQVGAVWPTSKGHQVLVLDAAPLDGKVYFFDPQDDAAAE